MKLSILICSLLSRQKSFENLMNALREQMTPDVEVVFDVDDGSKSIGQKRNNLLERASGEWVCFIDDDDEIAEDYVSSVLEALKSRPDCVGFKVDYYENGIKHGVAIHSLRYSKYAQHVKVRKRYGVDQMEYERTPNHLNPVRRELALQTRFPDLDFREDTDYAVRLRPLLKTEVFIDRVLYAYLFVKNKK